MAKTDNFETVQWADYFYYDETSPSCLRWNVDVRRGKGRGYMLRPKDSPAGSLNKHTGYYHVYLNNVSYLVHRIIYKLVKLQGVGSLQVDHVDGDRTNNRAENLRLVVAAINARNRGVQSNNSSGLVGVFYREIPWRNGSGSTAYWVAKWTDHTTMKGVSKTFSVAKFGFEQARQMAVNWRLKMLHNLNELGNGYSERHVASSGGSLLDSVQFDYSTVEGTSL